MSHLEMLGSGGEPLSGFMKSKEQAELGGGEALPVKLVEVLVIMLG